MQYPNPSAAAVALYRCPAGPAPVRAGWRHLLPALRGLLLLLTLLALALAGPAQAQTTSYAYTGTPQIYTVPAGVTAVQVVATGAGGGAYGGNTNFSVGGQVQAWVAVIPGEVLTVMVGGQGGSGVYAVEGGYNGGGDAYDDGGGGGASDVRRAIANGRTSDYLASRNALVVAGGGGGSHDSPGRGGRGGSPDGRKGSIVATYAGGGGDGATQTGPGAGGYYVGGILGRPGIDNVGGSGRNGLYGSGGGGGYYGGGGSTPEGGGGGGSSWGSTFATAINYGVALAAGHGSVTITPAPTLFGYTGSPQTYRVPAGVRAVQVVATGASGGVPQNSTNYSLGARVQALVAVTPGEVLTVVVGSQGGYNGGGPGYQAGAGGGASDVRRASTAGSTGDYLTSRNALVVAGGGGGGYVTPNDGGDGGTPRGGSGSPYSSAYTASVGGGASQTAPGSGGNMVANGVTYTARPGSNGTGGAGNTTFGCGGGGGYYGGGGSTPNGGAGGGSSWVEPTGSEVSYAVAADPGNGAVVITPVPAPATFTYTGSPQTYTVPSGITALQVVATGASGGVLAGRSNYSRGARVEALVLVRPGEVLTLMVGGQGSSGSSGPVAGGYNGGGAGAAAGAGGGASDVRRASAIGRTSDYLATRNALVVAAGGGGSTAPPATGGYGGSPMGNIGAALGSTTLAGSGGSLTGPGSAGGSGTTAATPGLDNAGGAGSTGLGGAGGGGGYYGGGGSVPNGGAGSGSSWVEPMGSTGITYDVASAASPGSITIVPLPLADIVVSTPGQMVPAGRYGFISVLDGGTATLAADVLVGGGVVVQNGGVLNDNCFVVRGPGDFTLVAGGTLGTCHAAGVVSTGAAGAVQVAGSRSFSNDAIYAYNGTTAQATGLGLPAVMHTLVLDNPAGLTLSRSTTVRGAVTLTHGVLSTGSNRSITLGELGTITETVDGYLLGTVSATQNIFSGSSSDFGGMGLTLISTNKSPGKTTVTRTTTASSGTGTPRLARRIFQITLFKATDFNVSMRLTVRADELNGIAPADLRLLKGNFYQPSWLPQAAATISTTAASGNRPATYTASLSGITSFQGNYWTLGTLTPLPVELTQFTATAAGPAAVRLAWATASEQNSAAFEVERSVDGVTFAAIGTVAAAGTSSTPRSYQLPDNHLPAGAALLYYRLRQVDLDGTVSYSPVRTVALTGAAAGLVLYPNPTHAGAATLTGTQPGAMVTVFDALGREVTHATADAAGTAALALPAGLPAGVYVVRVGSKALRLTVE